MTDREQQQRFATEDDDHAFIDNLVRAVEQCVVYLKLHARMQRARQALSKAQMEYDTLQLEREAYQQLEQPVLAPLIESITIGAESSRAILEDCREKSETGQEALRLCTEKR